MWTMVGLGQQLSMVINHVTTWDNPLSNVFCCFFLQKENAGKTSENVFFPLRVREFEGFDFKKMMLVEGPMFFFLQKTVENEWKMFGKKTVLKIQI